ncbi:MAG: nitroreductase family protein [Candidatus Schekmanbacteria bacterium]|nr:nitroreductase family protein [Candidatus Schekmanbacteria bacterium]
MNAVIKNIHERRSVRKFSAEPIPKEDWEIILDAARVAPSGNNLQPWFFLVVSNKELLDRMAKAVMDKVDLICSKIEEGSARKFKKYSTYYTFFNQAPAVIVVLRTKNNYDLSKLGISEEVMHELGFSGDERGREGYPDIQSVAASIQNILLAAASLGYGTCWMTGPLLARKELAEMLDLEGIRKEEQAKQAAPETLDMPWEIMALVPVGRPKAAANPESKPSPKARRQLDEIVRYVG